MNVCDLPPTHEDNDDSELELIIARVFEGAAAAVRAEVRRLRLLGLPVYVWRDGHVVDDCTGEVWTPAGPAGSASTTHVE